MDITATTKQDFESVERKLKAFNEKFAKHFDRAKLISGVTVFESDYARDTSGYGYIDLYLGDYALETVEFGESVRQNRGIVDDKKYPFIKIFCRSKTDRYDCIYFKFWDKIIGSQIRVMG